MPSLKGWTRKDRQIDVSEEERAVFVQSSISWRGGGAGTELYTAESGPGLRAVLTKAPEPGSRHNCPIAILSSVGIQGASEIQPNTVRSKCTQNHCTAEKRMTGILKR